MNGQPIILNSPEQARAVLKEIVLPWIGEQLTAGRACSMDVRLLEDLKTDKQRAYLHGCILANIALQARPNGEKFPLKVWKEWYRNEFLGFRTVTHTNPFTKKPSRRRQRLSTEDLGIRKYADYIERVIAHAVTELGVRFPEEWTDPDTGEVFFLKNADHRRQVRERKKELGIEA